MIPRRPIIGVMGSHDKEWDELAAPVGRLIAEHDYHLLTGAGAGVMTAVARAFTSVPDRAGMSIGILPTTDYHGGFISHEQYPNPYIEIPIVTPLDKKVQGDTSPYSRNYVNIMTSHAVIILPGEHGTQNEVSLAIMFKKPMILFGPAKAFEKFPAEPTRVEDINEVREFLEKTISGMETSEDH